MADAQQPASQKLDVWYVDSNPKGIVTKFFTDKGYKITEIKRAPELVAACDSLKGTSGELKPPQAVLLGSLTDVTDTSQTLVKQLAGYGIENFTPFSMSYGSNSDLLRWKKEEKAKEGLEHINIVGFGPEAQQSKPLMLFQFGTTDAEAHFAKWAEAIRPTGTLSTQARR